MLSDDLQQIQTVQPEGPYRISGYSFGASVAIEIAIQLQDANATKGAIDRLILLDGSHNTMMFYVEGKTKRMTSKYNIN